MDPHPAGLHLALSQEEEQEGPGRWGPHDAHEQERLLPHSAEEKVCQWLHHVL